MSKHVNCERFETKPATDKGLEAEGCASLAHSFFIRVEYYRSLEYHFKWKSSMYSTRSSKLQKTSKKAQKSPSPHEDVIQRRLRGNRRTGQREAQTDDSIVISDELTDRDLIDLIDDEQDAEHVIQEDERNPLEAVDEVVSESVDGDLGSVSSHSFSSTASGPSILHVKQSPAQGWCSGCQKLYQKAKMMKALLKDKLLDNDPTSLTCDQWVLMKKWRPRRLRNKKGKLWIHLRAVKKRLCGKTEGQKEQSACSRPHTFLQRNLRQCVKVPVKSRVKKSRRKRKRTRDDAQDPHLAKQQRLHSDSLRQYIDSNSIDNSNHSLYPSNGDSSNPGSEGCSEKKDVDQADTPLVIEVIPSSVTMETTQPTEAPPKQSVRKARDGFRDLLSQLRGNSSMIVRETC
ncbi:uncharacterized protein [Centroberyx affinis]|uniref:uncharacterized protein isoform X1 n=2 Tax=Centroberyx affinis TaxID=166261 RepID=UPI003A5C6B03